MAGNANIIHRDTLHGCQPADIYQSVAIRQGDFCRSRHQVRSAAGNNCYGVLLSDNCGGARRVRRGGAGGRIARLSGGGAGAGGSSVGLSCGLCQHALGIHIDLGILVGDQLGRAAHGLPAHLGGVAGVSVRPVVDGGGIRYQLIDICLEAHILSYQ